MTFQEISVYPAFPNAVVIQWSLTDTSMPGTYRFQVERSGSPEGPWVTLTPTPVQDVYVFIDREVKLIVKENRYFYRVIFIDPSGRQFTSDAQDLLRNLKKHDFLLASEFNRKESLRLVQYVGVEAYLLKRKHYGERCTSCFDPATGKIVKSKCFCCYGTKYVGGYFPPIPIYVEIQPFPKVSRLEAGGQGTSEQFVTSGRMPAYPLVARADIIVERENNRRWHIMKVVCDELRTVPVVQRLEEIREIARTDIEYRILVVDPLEAVTLEVEI